MKNYYYSVILVGMLAVMPSLFALDVLIQSRIKGALMAAALGDAFALIVNKRTKEELEPVSSFTDLEKHEWVVDSKGCRIGIGTENTLNAQHQFETLVVSRYKQRSPESLMSSCEEALHLDNVSYADDRIMQHLDVNEAAALIRAVPVGVAFSDDLPTLLYFAELQMKLTNESQDVCTAGIALAAGMAEAINGASVDDIISSMISAALSYDESSCVAEYISQAVIAAQNGEDLIGSKLAKSPGRYQGYTAPEALAAAVYCFVRSPGEVKESLMCSVHAYGNNTVISYLVGALSGAYNGFWGLEQQGYTDDLEMLEKVNVLQGTCNDLYVLLSDYPAYKFEQLGLFGRLRKRLGL